MADLTWHGYLHGFVAYGDAPSTCVRTSRSCYVVFVRKLLYFGKVGYRRDIVGCVRTNKMQDETIPNILQISVAEVIYSLIFLYKGHANVESL